MLDPKILREIEIQSIQKGNTAGTLYTESLTQSDEHWINSKKTQLLFSLAEKEGFCTYRFYGWTDAHSAKDLEQIQLDLVAILDKHSHSTPEFRSYLLALLRRRIFMVGLCSC